MLVSGYKSGYRDTTTIMDLAKNTTCQVEAHPCAAWAITGGSVTYDGALTPIVCGGQGNSYCKACYAYKVFVYSLPSINAFNWIVREQTTLFSNYLSAKSPNLLHTKICCIMPVKHLGKFVLSGWNDLRLERAGVGSDQRSLDVLCWRLEPTGQHKPQVLIPHQCRRYHSLFMRKDDESSNHF